MAMTRGTVLMNVRITVLPTQLFRMFVLIWVAVWVTPPRTIPTDPEQGRASAARTGGAESPALFTSVP